MLFRTNPLLRFYTFMQFIYGEFPYFIRSFIGLVLIVYFLTAIYHAIDK
jgi:hypothetical protein